MYTPDPNSLNNESDVEQKFTFPLLKTLLGYNNEEIKTKDYLSPTDQPVIEALRFK